MKKIGPLLLAILIPVAVGAISGFFTASSVDGWFTTLQKPSFNPPNWLFGPVWTSLYILMGIASWMVWKQPASVQRTKALRLYGVQLFFNFCWSLIFFYLHQPGWAFLEIIILWLLILLTIFSFSRVQKTSPWLLVPYISWVSFASILNYAIWNLNK